MSAKKLITLALAAALPLSVWAVPVETAATGKNQEAALKKAEVNAVRNVMLTITDEEFVRGHVSDIRQQIILNSGNLVTGSEILSSESNDSGQTTVRARFEVDRDKMAGIISKIGGGTAETPVTADTANTEPPKTDPETGDTAKTETAGTGTADPAKPEATQAGPEVSPAPTPGADPRIAERWLVTKIARDIHDGLAAVGDGVAVREVSRKTKDSGEEITQYEIAETDPQNAGDKTEDSRKTFDLITTRAPEGVTAKLAISDALFEAMEIDDVQRDTVRDILEGTSGFYSIADDSLKVTTGLKENSRTADDITVKWAPAVMETTMHSLTAYKDSLDYSIKLPSLEILETEEADDEEETGEKKEAGKKSVLLFGISDFGLTAQNRQDSFQADLSADKISYSPIEIRNLRTGFTSKIDAASHRNSLGYSFKMGELILAEPDAGEDERFDIKNASAELSLNNLDTSAMAAACGDKTAGMNMLQFSKCNMTIDEDARDAAILGLVGWNFSASLNLGAELGGSRISAKATAGIRPKPEENTSGSGENATPAMPDLPGAIILDADISIDAALLGKPQYIPEDMTEMLKQYAQDPAAPVYTYHLEFRDGALKINGKDMQ